MFFLGFNGINIQENNHSFQTLNIKQTIHGFIKRFII